METRARKLTPKELIGLCNAHVEQVYSGKQGCMCGCLGKYYMSPSPMVTKVLRLLKADSRLMLQDGYILYIDFPQQGENERSYVAYLHEHSLPLEAPTE